MVVKCTGDVHVPMGQCSFRVPLGPGLAVRPWEEDDEQAGPIIIIIIIIK